VSRSESLEREVKIFCLSSTIAKWEDSDEDLEDGVDWVWGFVFFILGGCELECECNGGVREVRLLVLVGCDEKGKCELIFK